MSRVGLLLAAVIASGAVAAAAAPRPRPPRAAVPRPAVRQPVLPAPALPRAGAPARRGDATAVTRCAACHVVASWSKVSFDHDPTGFPLRGSHQEVRCRDCHAHDFARALPDTCSGCHRDRHQGEFGLLCQGCHDEASWRPLLQADGHRRTAFPLTGRHALIPCQECHGNLRDRTFTRAPLGCQACHRADYERARLTSIDHAAAGFGTECQGCHATWSFSGARFDGHDTCFRISAGAHQGISCRGCHSRQPGFQVSGACNTLTATCTSCHSHDCAKSDRQHANVMGYECRDRKCYECHRQDGF